MAERLGCVVVRGQPEMTVEVKVDCASRRPAERSAVSCQITPCPSSSARSQARSLPAGYVLYARILRLRTHNTTGILWLLEYDRNEVGSPFMILLDLRLVTEIHSQNQEIAHGVG